MINVILAKVIGVLARIAGAFMLVRHGMTVQREKDLKDENANLKDVIGTSDDALADKLRDRAKSKRNRNKRRGR